MCSVRREKEGGWREGRVKLVFLLTGASDRYHSSYSPVSFFLDSLVHPYTQTNHPVLLPPIPQNQIKIKI